LESEEDVSIKDQCSIHYGNIDECLLLSRTTFHE